MCCDAPPCAQRGEELWKVLSGVTGPACPQQWLWLLSGDGMRQGDPEAQWQGEACASRGSRLLGNPCPCPSIPLLVQWLWFQEPVRQGSYLDCALYLPWTKLCLLAPSK